MANGLNSNVRFYKLNVLPDFNSSKHIGIFVHVTTGDITHKAGLWFGGENGWEYLTNDTNAIDAKIQELDVTGYAQATITNSAPAGGESNSTLTISGIQEVDGKIVKDDNNKFEVAIDGVYNESTNKIATQSTVTNAINNLNANTFQAVTFNTPENGGNTTLTFNGVKEENGVIAQGDGGSTFIVGDAKLKIQIGSNEAGAFEVFSANAKANSTIQLDGLVFKKNGDVISVITPTALASDNRLVTEKDVASLAGAMHYKGTVSSLEDFKKIIDNTDSDSDAEEAGNVYIATGNFTHGNNVISTGDMIVFNGATNYNVIQSNITLGTGSGQIAANSAALVDGNLVAATTTGIETIEFDKDNLINTTKNTRTLSIANGGITDGDFHHAVIITDTFKVIGKDFSKSITITSNNRSIDIANNGDTGVMVDLVWNTSIEQ